MRKVYLVPNMITAFGLACGLFVIFKLVILHGDFDYYNVMRKAVLFLLLASFADFIDGAVARVMHAESKFGLQFDSLADSISFGVAPAVLLLKGYTLEPGLLSFSLAGSAMIYALCATLRLVRYNVQSEKSEGDLILVTAKNKHFTGLPVPAAAAGAISINLFFLSPFSSYLGFSEKTRIIILIFVMIFLGYFMVSRWKFPSLKALHFKVPSFHLAFFTGVFALFLLYGFLYYLPIALTVIAWGYILIALIFAIIRVIAGRKSQTLEEYEPDPEDEVE
jgi:CDP-diacylglycerol---serine O-phosphatidyltransferase